MFENSGDQLLCWFARVVVPWFLFLQGQMHSYQEALDDSEVDRVTHSPTFRGGGENSPQTPRFPVSPQTPYFNMCRLTQILQTLKSFLLFIALQTSGTNQSNK